MPVKVTVMVEGLRDLGERLRGLSEKMAKKSAHMASAKAASVIKKQAVQNIINSPSVVTGSLRDSVIVKRMPKSQQEGLTSLYKVTVRKGKSNTKGTRKSKTPQKYAPHAHFIEYGTVNMPAEPFLRPAFGSKKEEALNKFRTVLADEISKAEAKSGL